ncbi:KH domain-containing protein [Patescibacteria group bacterium]|nr:KH domain-containing protein [Patescibacteria group bacterium]MBU2219935.1 KH domain-containing protein [Patescibacteria group bacterium]MBU2265196.1 KH domain-containing protein [Patescibacteria group bacterium]
MEQEKLSKIKEVAEGVIAAMGIDGRVSLSEEASGVLVNVESQEAGYLIGRNGDNLRALQQLIRLLASKKAQEMLRLTVDVNNYQQEALAALKESAKNLARQVAEQKTPRYLPAMNAYERREVHMALADMPQVKTDSEGEGEGRRIVIRPV